MLKISVTPVGNDDQLETAIESSGPLDDVVAELGLAVLRMQEGLQKANPKGRRAPYDKRTEAAAAARHALHLPADGDLPAADCGVDHMRYKTVAGCPKDCPRRCAVPNCHNPETCETWAQYLAELGAIKEARAKQGLRKRT